MSSLEEMCESLAEIGTLSRGLSVQLDVMSSRVEQCRDESRHVIGSSASLADILSEAAKKCGEAADLLRSTSDATDRYISSVRR